jgi:hypothetical protein
VAAAAVGAGVGSSVGATLKDAWGGSPLGDFAVRSMSGLASGVTASVVRDGRVNVQQVAADAFGNALGNGLVDAMTTQNTAQESFRQSEIREQNYDARMALIVGSGLQPRRSGSGIQPSAGAMARWSNDIDASIVNGSENLANQERVQRLLDMRPTADASGNALGIWPSDDRGFFPASEGPGPRYEPRPGQNRDAVMRGAYGRLQDEARLNKAFDDLEAAAQAARELRQGWGGAGRGLREGVVNVALSPYHLYTSVRDRGVLGTAGAMLEGMANMPSMLYEAAQNGDMQTLASTGVETLLGAKVPVGRVASAAGRSVFELGERAAVRFGDETGIGRAIGNVGDVTIDVADAAKMLPPPNKGMFRRAVDAVIHGNGDHVHGYWGELNANEYAAIRGYIGRTDAGQKVIAGLDNRDIFLRYTSAVPDEVGLIGVNRGGSAKVFLQMTENGRYYSLLGRGVNGLEYSANIGLHEGLHGLGVGGSRRAEALVRLEELRSSGVSIDRTAMRQVLTDMRGNYDHLPWYSGRTSSSFPGLKF